MERILGTLVLAAVICLAGSGLNTAWGAEVYDVQRRYVDMPENVRDTFVSIPVDTSAVRWTFEARAALEGRGKKSAWGIGWTDVRGRICNVEVTRVAGDNIIADDIVTEPSLRIVAAMGDSCLCDNIISKGMATASGYNTLSVEVSRGEITIYAGTELLERVATVAVPSAVGPAPLDECHFAVRGDVRMDYAVIEEGYPAWRRVATSWTRDSLDNYVAASYDVHEGMWRYLDREMDPAVSRLGGKYQVVLVANSEGGYDIIYYSGAETGADWWRCGMLKGTLTPSPFAGQYDLKWYDAQFRCHTDEAYATFSEGNRLLTLSLPLLRATLRLARL